MKSLILLAAFLFVTIIATIRKVKGKRELAALESGKLCVFCRGTNVTPAAAGVVCGSCGQTTLWSLIKHTSPTAEEIDKVNRPDARSPFDA